VVRWLQAGAVAAGLGMALAAAPVAVADEGTSSTVSGPTTSSHRSAATDAATRPAALRSARSATRGAVPDGSAATSSIPTSHAPQSAAIPRASSAGRRSGAPAAARPAAADPVGAAGILPRGAAAVAVSTDPLANVAAFFGLPGAPATSAPALNAVPLLVRLTLEDVISGTGPAQVTNPTAVVTGLFNEVLRENPTTDELQNYLGVLGLTGVNGVVAGLYSSSQFRQQEVANYYLELLSRPATQNEISWGAGQLMWGTPAPLFAASIARTPEFYATSASGGGQFGPKPTANSYVNLLYRTLVGQAADPTTAAIYVQQLQAGLPTGFVARDFVTSDTFRTVTVNEIFSVLGQTPDSAQVAGYVDHWFLYGGLAGISTSLLAASSNVENIEAGQVSLPDTAAAAKLQTLLLSPYGEAANPTSFYAQFGTLLSLDGTPISDTNQCTPSNTQCDQALFQLLTQGAADRGLPNSSLVLAAINANVATMIPTQNQIDVTKSLKYPLQDPAQLTTYFQGGLIQFSTPVLTADDGTYIVDGHHRWSGVVLINPYAQMAAVDIGYVPTPQDGLKQAQAGVAAVNYYLPSSTADEAGNLYTMSEAAFNDYVNQFIQAGSTPDDVLAVFAKNLNYSKKTPIEQQYVNIDNYLWSNVLRMRTLNPYVPGATTRVVMPQTDPLPLTQTYFASGALSYTFPTISYLG